MGRLSSSITSSKQGGAGGGGNGRSAASGSITAATIKGGGSPIRSLGGGGGGGSGTLKGGGEYIVEPNKEGELVTNATIVTPQGEERITTDSQKTISIINKPNSQGELVPTVKIDYKETKPATLFQQADRSLISEQALTTKYAQEYKKEEIARLTTEQGNLQTQRGYEIRGTKELTNTPFQSSPQSREAPKPENNQLIVNPLQSTQYNNISLINNEQGIAGRKTTAPFGKPNQAVEIIQQPNFKGSGASSKFDENKAKSILRNDLDRTFGIIEESNKITSRYTKPLLGNEDIIEDRIQRLNNKGGINKILAGAQGIAYNIGKEVANKPISSLLTYEIGAGIGGGTSYLKSLNPSISTGVNIAEKALLLDYGYNVGKEVIKSDNKIVVIGKELEKAVLFGAGAKLGSDIVSIERPPKQTLREINKQDRINKILETPEKIVLEKINVQKTKIDTSYEIPTFISVKDEIGNKKLVPSGEFQVYQSLSEEPKKIQIFGKGDNLNFQIVKDINTGNELYIGQKKVGNREYIIQSEIKGDIQKTQIREIQKELRIVLEDRPYGISLKEVPKRVNIIKPQGKIIYEDIKLKGDPSFGFEAAIEAGSVKRTRQGIKSIFEQNELKEINLGKTYENEVRVYSQEAISLREDLKISGGLITGVKSERLATTVKPLRRGEAERVFSKGNNKIVPFGKGEIENPYLVFVEGYTPLEIGKRGIEYDITPNSFTERRTEVLRPTFLSNQIDKFDYNIKIFEDKIKPRSNAKIVNNKKKGLTQLEKEIQRRLNERIEKEVNINEKWINKDNSPAFLPHGRSKYADLESFPINKEIRQEVTIQEISRGLGEQRFNLVQDRISLPKSIQKELFANPLIFESQIKTIPKIKNKLVLKNELKNILEIKSDIKSETRTESLSALKVESKQETKVNTELKNLVKSILESRSLSETKTETRTQTQIKSELKTLTESFTKSRTIARLNINPIIPPDYPLDEFNKKKGKKKKNKYDKRNKTDLFYTPDFTAKVLQESRSVTNKELKQLIKQVYSGLETRPYLRTKGGMLA